jgi:hypothetical protein
VQRQFNGSIHTTLEQIVDSLRQKYGPETFSTMIRNHPDMLWIYDGKGTWRISRPASTFKRMRQLRIAANFPSATCRGPPARRCRPVPYRLLMRSMDRSRLPTKMTPPNIWIARGGYRFAPMQSVGSWITACSTTACLSRSPTSAFRSVRPMP